MTLKSIVMKFSLHLLWFTASMQSSGNFEGLQSQMPTGWCTANTVCITGALLDCKICPSLTMTQIKIRWLFSAGNQFKELVVTLSKAQVSLLPRDSLTDPDTWFPMLSSVNCPPHSGTPEHGGKLQSAGGFPLPHLPRFCHMLKTSQPMVTRMSPYLQENRNHSWHQAPEQRSICVSLGYTLEFWVKRQYVFN